MDIEEKLTALWNNTESTVLLFNILRYCYYGMVVLGYLIIIYLLFGLDTFIYFSIGTLIAIGIYFVYRIFGQRLVQAFIK